MKRTIRMNVFETNSSSVHSISVCPDGMEESKLPTDRDGYVLVRYGQFGRNSELYCTQEEKLSYLVTQCYYLGGWEYKMNEDNYHFRNVVEAIRDYTGCEGIRIVGGEPEIDHQMMPEYEIRFVNEYDPKSIQEFVFNKYIRLKTDCD